MPTLFDPIRIGDLDLPNRIIMAPLTRSRAVGEGRIPNALMAEYYVQRVSAGLIISEATSVTPQGVGYADTPGIWSDEQVAGWRLVTDAVHAAGGRIFMQLWHVGRVSDPVFLNGERPVAPSAIAVDGHVSLLRPKRPFVVPRALESDEIPGIVEMFRRGAENAKVAGFDGVEVHGANGYLFDQFLQDNANFRTDQYGGSVENRARLLLEVTDACISVWGASRVGVHLSPRGGHYSMADSNPMMTFEYVARELGKRGIAFIFSRDPVVDGDLGKMIKETFGSTYIANEELTKESAAQALADGRADAVAFGHLFISNPDLPHRLLIEAPFNDQQPETFMAPGPVGYIDYPVLT
ncbi:alkene reductase [Photorhabdus stackebrandtii]|uniref:Alkene reductase n=1 Tax=Photorhabdus stackebrandtii TaxID=1123042 RepID=A0A7X5QLD1_9GAMM|nr:alkene reductase [Photorhabdus stackebrandtii]NHB96553.1 alkene reductase [Photorhabdus stackebrandtii]